MNWKLKISGSFFISLMVLLSLVFITVLLFINRMTYSNIFDIQNGRIELTESDLEYNILLRGEWKFIPGEFITPEDSYDSYSIRSIPDSWGSTGYGTYILEVGGLAKDGCYSIYIPDQSTACSLYIDSRLAAEIGTIGSDRDSEKIHLEPKIASFEGSGEDTTISLLVSNFNGYPGGFIRALKIGRTENIRKEYTREVAIQMLLFGGLLITALYNLCLFILNLNERPAAFFAVLTLSMAARTLLTGQRIINLWFPSTDWNISFMILFVLGALVLASFILLLNSLFRNQFNPAAVRISLSLCGILIVLPFAVPAEHLRFADLFFFGISLLFFIYTIYVLIIAVRKKMQGAVFAFAGIIFVICTILLDMAFPPGSNIIPIGVFIFIIFQSLVVGERHSQAVEQNRMLHNVAVRDGMTNLYKKDHFRKLIASAIADGDSSRQHALLFIDIDDFKTVNDTYGHELRRPSPDRLRRKAADFFKTLRYRKQIRRR